MKKLIYISFLFLLIFSACKKDDESKKTSTINGVLKLETGEVLADAIVSLNQNSKELKVDLTDENGAFVFEDISSGSYTLGAYDEGYKNSRVLDYVVESNTDHDLTFVFEPIVSISGLVIDAFGNAISSATVSLYISGLKDNTLSGSTETDELGRFEFYDLEPGMYQAIAITPTGRDIEMVFHVVEGIESKIVLSYGEGGTFKDSRDNKEYRYVKIGDQTWMAENLAYLPQVDKLSDGSEDHGYTSGKYYYVYNFTPNVSDDEDSQVAQAKLTDNYENYGVLYSWHAAINDEGASTSNPSGVQGACPDGWHLPSYNEFYDLRNYVQANTDYAAGTALKSSGNTTDGTGFWVKNPDYEGIDYYGYAGVPGGRRQYNGAGFYYLGNYGRYWTSSQSSSTRGYYFYFHYGNTSLNGANNSYKSYGWSVRCVKDE